MVSVFIFFPRSKANATLILCANDQLKVFVVIDNQYACPAGYVLASDEYTLIHSGYTQDVTYDPTNPDPSTGSGTGGGVVTGIVTGGSTGSGTQGTGGTVVTTTTYSTGAVNGVTQGDSGANAVSGAGSVNLFSSGNASGVINPQTTTMPDPTLANGPFVNLDPTDYSYCVSLSHDLVYGIKDSSTGGDVSALQSYLTDRGFLETGATGFYGRATEVGVKRFQYRNELSVTGIVTSDTRDILKELTCVKYPRVTYVDKPLSPGKFASKTTTRTVVNTKKTTIIPATKALTSQSATTTYMSVTPSTNSNTIIPPTTQTPAVTTYSGPTLNNSKLSSIGGTISLSRGNNLFFTFSSNSNSPSICINLGSLDCSKSSNYSSVSDGVNGSFYEATNISGKWAFTIYGNRTWGSSGNKVNIFLKDSPSSNTISVYTVLVAN